MTDEALARQMKAAFKETWPQFTLGWSDGQCAGKKCSVKTIN